MCCCLLDYDLALGHAPQRLGRDVSTTSKPQGDNRRVKIEIGARLVALVPLALALAALVLAACGNGNQGGY
jgi:hypothetical protein